VLEEKKMTIWCVGKKHDNMVRWKRKKNDNMNPFGREKNDNMVCWKKKYLNNKYDMRWKKTQVIFFFPNSDLENVFHLKSRNTVIFLLPKPQLN